MLYINNNASNNKNRLTYTLAMNKEKDAYKSNKTYQITLRNEIQASLIPLTNVTILSMLNANKRC